MDLYKINDCFEIIAHKSKNTTTGKDTLSNQVYTEQLKGQNIIGAINGDFFNLNSGIPVCTNIVNGEIFSTSITKHEEDMRPCFAILENGQIDIDHYYFNGNIKFEKHNKKKTISYNIKLDSINRNDYIENTINVFNHKNNNFSTVNLPIEREDAMIILITPENNDSCFYNNRQIKGFVKNIINDAPNTYKILENEIAIIAYDNKKSSFHNIEIGMDIFLDFNIQKIYDNDNTSKIKHLLTSHEFIVYNNSIPDENYFSITWNNNNCPYNKNYRTALGLTNHNTLIMITVDKKDSFKGMTLNELGNFLISKGVYKAINLDGGGSTSMMIRNLGNYNLETVNYPREFRNLSNSLMVINKMPYVREIRQLYYYDSRTIKINEIRKLNFIAIDVNLNPIDIYLNPSLKLSSDVGIFDTNGFFHPNSQESKGSITIDIDGITQTYEIEIIN